MARKYPLINWLMFGANGCDLSVAQTHSSVTEINLQDNVGVIITWTGTSPVGAIVFEVSNNNSTWNSLDFGSAISISGNTGNHTVNINQLPYSFIRATYNKTSGTGTLIASLTSKQMGG